MTDSKQPTNSETGSSSRIDPNTDIEAQVLTKMFEQLLLAIAFKGTIQQIRALVNDPKWDDKP